MIQSLRTGGDLPTASNTGFAMCWNTDGPTADPGQPLLNAVLAVTRHVTVVSKDVHGGELSAAPVPAILAPV